MSTEQSQLIGKVIATEKAPTTIDSFGFWTKPDLILNPFDIVKVRHINGSWSYGVIEDISHLTDSASFLTDFISNDFGDLTVHAPTLRIGMNYVKANVILNDKNIYTPLCSNSEVYLASAAEIEKALGLDNVKNPLVCGYLEMYENTTGQEPVFLPVKLNSKFIIGPEGAHLNISGISGLAAKTSYAMFLLKAIQDIYNQKQDSEDENDDSAAFIFFNVKGCDLLSIDEANDFKDEENPGQERKKTEQIYEKLGLEPTPFNNVHYYIPHQSTHLPEKDLKTKIKADKAKEYVYTYEDVKDNLDLMFADIDDSAQTMDSIITHINSDDLKHIDNWKSILDYIKDKTLAGGRSGDREITVASWRKFYRLIRKNIYANQHIFKDSDVNGRFARLHEVLSEIKKNQIYVIDIAKLNEEMQSFVFGCAVRTICSFQLGEYEYDEDTEKDKPRKIIIFIDELNKYASKDAPKNSPLLRQILDIAERGRSLGIILFGAEQFRSAIHDRVTGNCSTHAYGRTNSIETAKNDYKAVPSVYKNIMTRLKQGEYIIQNPILRSMLHIKFPKPIYKQNKQ